MHQSNGCFVIYCDWTLIHTFKINHNCLFKVLNVLNGLFIHLYGRWPLSFDSIIRTALRLDSLELHKTQQNISIMPWFLGKQALLSVHGRPHEFIPLSIWVSAPVNPHRVIPHIPREVWFICMFDPHMIWWKCGMKWAFWDVDPRSFRHTGNECVLEHVSQRLLHWWSSLIYQIQANRRENHILEERLEYLVDVILMKFF